MTHRHKSATFGNGMAHSAHHDVGYHDHGPGASSIWLAKHDMSDTRNDHGSTAGRSHTDRDTAAQIAA